MMEGTMDAGHIKPVEIKETTEASEGSSISPAGINAIRGLNQPTQSTRPDAEKIYQIAPRQYVAGAPPLTPSAANDLELASQRAMAAKATHYHETGEGKIHEYHRLRSEITEDLSCQNVENGVRTDAYSPSGTNFPTYDVFGSAEVSSVKAFSLKDGQPRYGAYRTAFMGITDSDSEANQKAAAALVEIKNTDPGKWQEMTAHLPAQVQEAANASRVSQELAETATLRIPDDQVEQVRQYLHRSVLRDPGKFGVSPEGSPAEIEAKARQLVDSKILSIDDRFQTAHYQGKAAELSWLRDLNLNRFDSSN